MSIMISLEKIKILTPLQKLTKNEGDLGKLIVSKGFEKLPKVQKRPNLVTLSLKRRSMIKSGKISRALVVSFLSRLNKTLDERSDGQTRIDLLCLIVSVTRLGDLLDFWQVFEAFGSNKFAQVCHILKQFL